jgi:hypothetical protein
LGSESEGAELLEALLAQPDMASAVKSRLEKISRAEIAVIMDRLLDAARQEQEWGAPAILDACLVVMTEAKSDCRLRTLDSDFRFYRRFERQAIPLIAPAK